MGLIVQPFGSGLPGSIIGLPTSESTTGASGIGIFGFGPITLYVKGIVIKQTGDSVPVDLVTFTIPAGITRWRLLGATTSAGSSCVIESASSTLAAASFSIFDAAGGAGTQVGLAATAPVSTGQWSALPTPTGPILASTSTIAVVRQTIVAVTSANRTCSFYLCILPLS